MPGIERIDDPPISRIDADVPGPPQDVAGAYFAHGDFGELLSNVVRRPRNAGADPPPRRLGEPRTIETRGTGAAPAIRLAHLGSGESDDLERLERRSRLATFPRPCDQRVA